MHRPDLGAAGGGGRPILTASPCVSLRPVRTFTVFAQVSRLAWRSEAEPHWLDSPGASASIPFSSDQLAMLWRVVRVSGWSGPRTCTWSGREYPHPLALAGHPNPLTHWRCAEGPIGLRLQTLPAGPANYRLRPQHFRDLGDGCAHRRSFAAHTEPAVAERLSIGRAHSLFKQGQGLKLSAMFGKSSG
jgi:hypothetical protein